MADKIAFAYTTGLTFYAILRTSAGTFVNGTTPEAYNASHRTNYALSVPEITASSGQYAVSFPSLTAGFYVVDIYRQAGGSPAASDAPPLFTGDYNWSGTAFRSLSAVNLDLTQALTDVKTATVGGALHGAWIGPFGKMILDRTNRLLKIFGWNSQVTPIATHDLDNGTAPTTRTPE